MLEVSGRLSGWAWFRSSAKINLPLRHAGGGRSAGCSLQTFTSLETGLLELT